MSKGLNAFATSRAFDYIAGLPGQKELFLMINDQACEKRWSENVCWLYDTDFEFLNRDDVVQIVCTGKRGLQLLVEALTPYRDALADYVDAGNRMLATGNALDALGKYVDIDGKRAFDGLGLLATHAEYHMLKRHSSFFLGKFQDMDIVGFKSVFGHTYPDDELSEALFRVERGVGRRPGSAAEGFRRGGLMATYLIGPLLVLNPPFTKWLLRELGAKSDDLAFEDTAVAAYNARLAEFRDEKINYIF